MTSNHFKPILAILAVILFIGLIAAPVSADYWSGYQTSVNVSMWTDMSNNVTNIRDSMIPANISALRGNGTVILDNGSVSWYGLTGAFAQINGGVQSLNFTTPSAGNYLIEADIRGNDSISSYYASIATNTTTFALCDANGTTIVANSERVGSRITDTNNFTATSWHFTWIYSNTTGASEVGICGKISVVPPSGRYGIASDIYGRSVLIWMRLP